MKPRSRILLPAFALLTLPAVLAVGHARETGREESAPHAEAARIAAHLATAEQELLARDVSHLSPAQRAARARHIRVLGEYRLEGVFPHNHDVPRERVPVFVDRHGTHCAVGYLLARSGRSDIVEQVARTRNLARIPEMTDDPALAAWLDTAGISLSEAARIQPTYGGGSDVVVEDEVTTGYIVASALSVGFGGISIARNLGPAPRRMDGIYGLLIGAYGIGLGGHKLDNGGTAQALGALNTVVGATAAALGARTLWRSGSGNRADVAPPGQTMSVAAGPTLVPGGTGLGIHLQMRF